MSNLNLTVSHRGRKTLRSCGRLCFLVCCLFFQAGIDATYAKHVDTTIAQNNIKNNNAATTCIHLYGSPHTLFIPNDYFKPWPRPADGHAMKSILLTVQIPSLAPPPASYTSRTPPNEQVGHSLIHSNKLASYKHIFRVRSQADERDHARESEDMQFGLRHVQTVIRPSHGYLQSIDLFWGDGSRSFMTCSREGPVNDICNLIVATDDLVAKVSFFRTQLKHWRGIADSFSRRLERGQVPCTDN